MTPASTLENQRPPSRASRGSSANSASGFSSSVRTNSHGCFSPAVGGTCGGGKDTVGVMFRNVLNATLLTTSAVSANVWQRCNPVRARKSSISRVPMLYPLCCQLALEQVVSGR